MNIFAYSSIVQQPYKIHKVTASALRQAAPQLRSTEQAASQPWRTIASHYHDGQHLVSSEVVARNGSSRDVCSLSLESPVTGGAAL